MGFAGKGEVMSIAAVPIQSKLKCVTTPQYKMCCYMKTERRADKHGKGNRQFPQPSAENTPQTINTACYICN
jgi:hypothetical protein